MASAKPFWSPPEAGRTPMDAYRQHVNARFAIDLKDSKELQIWSVEHQQDFWLDLYAHLGLVPPLPATMTRAYDETKPISSIPTWFRGLKINYAENVLFANPDPDAIALIGLRETAALHAEDNVTWHELRKRVQRVASALKRHGIDEGDRVAALVSTSVWAMVLFFATASIGAVFTSISPDLGVEVRRACQYLDTDRTNRYCRAAFQDCIRSLRQSFLQIVTSPQRASALLY